MRLLLYVFIFAMGGLSLASVATSETLHQAGGCPAQTVQLSE